MAEEAAGRIPRADRKDFQSSKYVRTENPAVANFVAGAIVQNFMDTERAVREIKPGLSPAQVAETAQKLERDPLVQREIQKTLEKRGLDEQSKEHFVDCYAESEKPEGEMRQLQAMRILGKAYIADRVQVDKPETLRLAGLEAGLKKWASSMMMLSQSSARFPHLIWTKTTKVRVSTLNHQLDDGEQRDCAGASDGITESPDVLIDSMTMSAPMPE
jgi:hypothetical protein